MNKIDSINHSVWEFEEKTPKLAVKLRAHIEKVMRERADLRKQVVQLESEREVMLDRDHLISGCRNCPFDHLDTNYDVWFCSCDRAPNHWNRERPKCEEGQDTPPGCPLLDGPVIVSILSHDNK